MTINKEQLSYLNNDYHALTGRVVRNFVCPITLLDEPNAELCDGHVLNRGIKQASKATVIQRKDIDNYFGATIEPDLIQWLNIPVLTGGELIRQASRMHISIPNGDKVEAFFAKSNAGAKFPQINLRDSDGTVVASPFLKTTTPDPADYTDVEVETLTIVTNTAVTGSLIKSAHLAIFRTLGYRWVFSPAGDKVRRTLADFYVDKGQKRRLNTILQNSKRLFQFCSPVLLARKKTR